jgi:hypothetical protein
MILGFRTKYRGRPTNFVDKILTGVKIHTFRADPENRWKAGMRIHMATGVGKKAYQGFNQVDCTGTQELWIDFHSALNGLPFTVYVDDRELSDDEARELIKNDGFDTVDDFLVWFREDFDGKIIHWTDFRY